MTAPTPFSEFSELSDEEFERGFLEKVDLRINFLEAELELFREMRARLVEHRRRRAAAFGAPEQKPEAGSEQ